MNNIDNYDIPNLHIFNSRPKKVFFTICEDMMAGFLLYSIILNFSIMILHINISLTKILFLLAYTLLLTLIRLNIKNSRLTSILSIILCGIFLTIPFQGYERFLYGLYAVLMTVNTIKKLSKEGFSFYTKNSFIICELVLMFNLLTAYGIHSSFLKYFSLFLALASSLLYLTYLSKRDLPTVLEETYVLDITINLGLRKFIIILFSTFLIFTSFIIFIANINTPFIPNGLASNVNNTLVKSLKIEDHLKTYNVPPIHWGLLSEDPSFIEMSSRMEGGSHHDPYTMSASTANIYFKLLAYAIGLIILFKIIKYIRNIKPEIKKKVVKTKSTFLQEDLKNDLKDMLLNFQFNLSNKDKLRKYYKRLIKRYGEKGLNVKDSSTSQELQDGILNLTGKDLENITELYHKCRYTTYEPTKEDIVLVKKSAKNRVINKDTPLENWNN